MRKVCLLFGIFLLMIAGFACAADFEMSKPQQNADPAAPYFGPYMRELQKRIKANWKPPLDGESKRVILLFRIDKSGQLVNSSIYKSSGNMLFDNEAMKALKNTAPFKPLPSEFKGKSVDIQFTFDMKLQWEKNLKMYYNELDKNMFISDKSLIKTSNGYKYVHVLKTKPFFNDTYLWRCKVDCKNRQIGVKKSYEGATTSIFMNLFEYMRIVNIYKDEVKMQSPDKNPDYLKIYNYVCQP